MASAVAARSAPALRARPRRRRLALALAALALAGGLASFAVLVTPDNPLTRAYQQPVAAIDGRISIGPYPVEEDFLALRKASVRTIVSLLDPTLPYERVLLDRERELAAMYGMTLLNFPMTSILGQGAEP